MADSGDSRKKPDYDIDPNQLRPLHIAKRGEAAKLKLTGLSEFVCRPMRLGLGVTTAQKRLSSSDKASLHTIDRTIDSVSDRSSDISMLSRLSRKLVSSAPNPDQLSTTNSSPIQVKNVAAPLLPRKISTDPSGILEMVFAICLVDFHHVRGPEVLWWRSNYLPELNSDRKLFRHLPFQALPDGSHLFEETFSNFNLVYDFRSQSSLDDRKDIDHFQGNPNHLETLFGCSCVRQIKTTDMSQEEVARNKDITRSIVQKAVVVITRKQPIFTKVKEKLSIITQTFFEQKDFEDFALLDSLFDNLNGTFKLGEDELPLSIKRPQTLSSLEDLLREQRYEEQEEYFVNLNLRGILFQFKTDMLVILKALFLEKKVMVYSSNDLELLTQFQNNMIALIPNLLKNLDLCGSPLCDYKEKHSPLSKPTSLKTNDRMSMLRFFGLPLQIFSTKGSFWNPYLPLQQIDELAADSLMIGCSNLIIANQLETFKIDVLVNLDDSTVSHPVGKSEDLKLSSMDKKFMSVLLSTTQQEDGYIGSDDYIRYQFEDYIRSLLSTTKLHNYAEKFSCLPPGFDIFENPNLGNVKNFGSSFHELWTSTKNYEIWNATCDDMVFNFHLPVHIAAELPNQDSSYLSGIISTFKKTRVVSKLSEKTSSSNSRGKEPQKFISKVADESQDNSSDQQEKESSEPKSYWNWGFKK